MTTRLANSTRRAACLPLIAAICLMLAGPSAAFADETPRTGVVDEVGVVSGKHRDQLNGILLELEQKTGAQLKVLVVKTTGGRDHYEYAMEMARRWRLGDANKKNGCLVLIAVNDRKWRIVTGEGIEGALPDLYCDTVAQNYFVPNFRKGDYSTGILVGTSALAKAVAKDAGIELSSAAGVQMRPARGRRADDRAGAVCGMTCVVLFILFVTIFRGIARNRRRGRRSWSGGDILTGMLLGQMLGGGRRSGRSSWSSSSSWGGGFGGGGGFSGGGGGSFGGGGAGGGW